VTLDKTLTIDNLRKQHVIVVNIYCICKRNEEPVDHHFLHCGMAYVIWVAFFSHFQVSLVIPRHVVNLYAYWWNAGNTQDYCCVEDLHI
jgi:hypothetical protein